jgi:hypothetical protein
MLSVEAARMLDSKLLRFLVVCDLPFRLADSAFFLDLMQSLRPGYVPASMPLLKPPYTDTHTHTHVHSHTCAHACTGCTHWGLLTFVLSPAPACPSQLHLCGDLLEGGSGHKGSNFMSMFSSLVGA